jgi:hypothetical protein
VYWWCCGALEWAIGLVVEANTTVCLVAVCWAGVDLFELLDLC